MFTKSYISGEDDFQMFIIATPVHTENMTQNWKSNWLGFTGYCYDDHNSSNFINLWETFS